MLSRVRLLVPSGIRRAECESIHRVAQPHAECESAHGMPKHHARCEMLFTDSKWTQAVETTSGNTYARKWVLVRSHGTIENDVGWTDIGIDTGSTNCSFDRTALAQTSLNSIHHSAMQHTNNPYSNPSPPPLRPLCSWPRELRQRPSRLPSPSVTQTAHEWPTNVHVRESSRPHTVPSKQQHQERKTSREPG